MVQQSLLALLLPVLALGAPQHHWGGDNWGPSAPVTSEVAMTSAPAASSPAYSEQPQSSSEQPQPTSAVASSAPASSPSAYSSSSGNGGQVSFKNNCGYDVTYDAVCPCGTSGGSGTVAAGSSWTDVLSDCSSGNTALKVYGNGSDKPMQFEYGLQDGNVWYDMSFINCIQGSDDFSQCAGSSWSMGSIGSCPTYSCSGGSECCTQGYCDPNANAIDPDPNAGCGAFQGYSVSDLSISINLC